MKVTAFVLTLLVILTGIAAGTAAIIGGYAASTELATHLMSEEQLNLMPGIVIVQSVVIFVIGAGALIGLSIVSFKGFRALYDRVHGPLIRWRQRRADAKIQKEIVRRERLEARKYKRHQDPDERTHHLYCPYPNGPCNC